MTATIAIVGSSAVHMITDGVMLAPPDNRVTGYTTKTLVLPHLCAVIGAAGPAGLERYLTSALFSQHTDIENLIDDGALQKDIERLGFTLGEVPTLSVARRLGLIPEGATVVPEGFRVQMTVIGWSRRGPRAWYSQGDRLLPAEAGNACGSPPPPADLVPWPDSPSEVFKRGALRLMAHLRESHPIGGPIVLTTIREREISQKVLHRYPDRVGEVLAPSGTLA